MPRKMATDPLLERELEHERGRPWKVLTDVAGVKAAIPGATAVYVRTNFDSYVLVDKAEAMDLLTKVWRQSRSHRFEASQQFFSSDERRFSVCIYGVLK